MKNLPRHLRPVGIIMTESEINKIYADINILHASTISSDEAMHDKHYLCRNARALRISDYTQTTVLICYQGAVVITIETHRSMKECWCFRTSRGVMGILPGNAF